MKVGFHPFFRNYFHLGANENKEDLIRFHWGKKD